MSITLVPGPEFAMRYNQSLYPVPEEFKTSGQYYKNLYEELVQDFDDCCCESSTQAMKADKRLEKFRNILGNIEHFATSVIQKHYLRYKRNRKMKTGNYFKALRHNGVNYSSVLHLLLKQKWQNYLQDKTDNILNYTCERVTEKINQQRAVVLIQRNFRRFSAELNYEHIRWVEHLKEQQRNRTVAESIEYYWAGWKQREEAKEREKEEEEEDWLVRGYEEMEAYRIEMEAERDARLEEDMDRMREMYFD
uniref:Uncharacterized protein n=1 Tax=viral metagenome TaxID=1070528 RepID=A0A6C0KFQ5_9ZZZZ